jgi:hypothetical protein
MSFDKPTLYQRANRRVGRSPTSSRRKAHERRGMAVLLVLVVLGISLVMAYGAMRVQSTAEQVQQNSIRRGDARQVAMTGLSEGLRRMNQTGWVGVGQNFSTALNSTDRYRITYTTGDADLLLKLDPTGVLTADNVTDATLSGYSADVVNEVLRYPYRVTVTATGYSKDPGTGVDVSHSVRAVVELAPKEDGSDRATLADKWQKFLDPVRKYVVYQRDNDEFSIHMPLKINGNVRVRGALKLNEDYDDWDDIGGRYLNGLRILRGSSTNADDDDRPITGNLVWDTAAQTGTIVNWLTSKLGLTQIAPTSDNVPVPGVVDVPLAPKYQLFPGGELYAPAEIASDVTSSPTVKPLSNPLRILYRTSNVRLRSNVNLKGTVVVSGSNGITIDGTNIRVDPANQPMIGSQDAAVQLPSIVTTNIRHSAERGAVLNGIVSVDDEFRIDKGSLATNLKVAGKLLAKRIRVHERTEWENDDWGLVGDLLSGVLGLLIPDDDVPDMGADYQPKIVFEGPDLGTTEVDYHWHKRILYGDEPLYKEPSAGSGLRWNIISWKDSP